jgi:RNA polymerase sigma-70 factor (ECF subfamily)
MSEAVASPFSSGFDPSSPSALKNLFLAGIERIGGASERDTGFSGIPTALCEVKRGPEPLGAPVVCAPLRSVTETDKKSVPLHSRLSSGAKPVKWEGESMSGDAIHIEAGGHAEDERLVARAQKGDTTAFDQLVEKHTSRLYGLVYHMTGNHEDTNDLLQDVWTKVFRSLAGFRGASRFTTWIHSIAVNMSINFLKRRSRRQTVSLDAGVEEGGAPDAMENLLVSPHTPRSEAGIAELQGRLSEALGRLSAEHRAVVTMFDIQGMAHAEIGKILGVSEGTVRSRLFYAHRQLQAFLSDLHMEGAVV